MQSAGSRSAPSALGHEPKTQSFGGPDHQSDSDEDPWRLRHDEDTVMQAAILLVQALRKPPLDEVACEPHPEHAHRTEGEEAGADIDRLARLARKMPAEDDQRGQAMSTNSTVRSSNRSASNVPNDRLNGALACRLRR